MRSILQLQTDYILTKASFVAFLLTDSWRREDGEIAAPVNTHKPYKPLGTKFQGDVLGLREDKAHFFEVIHVPYTFTPSYCHCLMTFSAGTHHGDLSLLDHDYVNDKKKAVSGNIANSR